MASHGVIKPRILAFLEAHPGEKLAVGEVATLASVTVKQVRNCLYQLAGRDPEASQHIQLLDAGAYVIWWSDTSGRPTPARKVRTTRAKLVTPRAKRTHQLAVASGLVSDPEPVNANPSTTDNASAPRLYGEVGSLHDGRILLRSMLPGGTYGDLFVAYRVAGPETYVPWPA